jgi:hypothetical protein
MKINQPKGIKLKIGGHKLRCGVHWQGAMKQLAIKQGFGVQIKVSCARTL